MNLIALDTETVRGEPYTIQLYDGEKIFFKYVNKNNILDIFINYLKEKIKLKKVNCIFVHNITYDIVVLLYKFYKKFEEDNFEIYYKGFKFEISIRRGKWFVSLQYKGTKIYFIDSFYFFPYSLEFIAEKLQLKFKKLPKPKGLGLIKLKGRKFEEYAINDAYIQFEVGKYISNLHKEYNIPMSVSIAQFSQFVFQTHFLEKEIPLPPERVIKYSILSYHGGKNYYYDKQPKLFKNLYEIDIISAYPYAMSILPSFYKGRYIWVDKFYKNKLGVYYLHADLKKTKYRVIPDRLFKYTAGEVKTWITSFELQKAIEDKLFDKIYKINGFIYEEESEKISPLKKFVDFFFDKKNNTDKKDPKYLFYKIVLNSLYGKFIQRDIDDEDITYLNIDGEKIEMPTIIRAGGLFHPFIATLITGFVRAYIYDLEKKYKAIHTSTDSIKTQNKIQENNKLGGLEIACYGDCIIFRPKLYIHYDKEGQIKKYALHGFQGRVENLEKIWKSKNPTYSRNRIIPIRESLIRKLSRPLQNEFKEYKLNVKL